MNKLSYVLLISLIISLIGCGEKAEAPPNNPPVITSFITGSMEVFTNAEVELAVLATDPDGDDLAYTYESLSGEIIGEGNMVIWIAPDLAGDYIIIADVSDGELSVQYLVTITVVVPVVVTPEPLPVALEDMILIPAGEFQMGSNDNPDEKPLHTVYIDAFYMDVYEVTNAQYQEFVDATGHDAPNYWDDPRFNAPDQPVVGVSWVDAKAYAEWVGKRLPTEAEWEKAARGGLTGHRYPWGDDVSHDNANYNGTDGRDVWEFTSPVGSFPPNGYGLYDMAGNVWELCADWYNEDYYSSSPERNPTGPLSSSWLSRVLRGGSWDDDESILRCANRGLNRLTLTHFNLGFRCCASRSN